MGEVYALVADIDTAPEYAPIVDAVPEYAPVADTDATPEEALVADIGTTAEDAPVADVDAAPEYAPIADVNATAEDAPVAGADTTVEEAPVADIDTAPEDEPVADAAAVPEDAPDADTDTMAEDAPVADVDTAPEDAPIVDAAPEDKLIAGTDAAPKDAPIVDAAPEEAPVANAAATAVNALATTDAHPAQPEELRLTSNMDSDAAVATSAQAETPPVTSNCAQIELTLATLAEASAGEVPVAATAPLAVKLPAANADTRIGELPVADVDMENSKPHSIDVDMQGGELLEADAEMHAEDSPAADNVMMVKELPAAATGMQVDESLGLGVYMDVANDQLPHLLGEPSSMPLPDISYIDIGALANDIQNAWPQSIASETAQSLEYLVGVVPSAPGDFNQANAAVGANVQAMSSTAPWPNNCDWSASARASAGGFDFGMLDESIGGFDFGNAGNSGVGFDFSNAGNSGIGVDFDFGSAASGSLGNNSAGNVLCMDPCLFNWDNVGFTPRADNLESATGAPFNNSSLSCETTTAIVDSMDIGSLLEMASHLTPKDFAELDAKVAAAGIIIDGDAANRYAADTALAMLADTAAMAPMAPTEGADTIPATPTESTVTTVPATPTESAGAGSASATPADSTDTYELYRPSSIAECSKWAAIRSESNTAASNKRSGDFTARCNGKRARNNGKQAVSEL
ncbi:hypothetical protein GGI00_001782 [Coemansia sp. RSA 2681]|nr:hypothetical protein GGI00_001782 [Coemansia sp. RSA 2681]